MLRSFLGSSSLAGWPPAGSLRTALCATHPRQTQPGHGAEQAWLRVPGRGGSRGAAPGCLPGLQRACPAAASPAVPEWTGGCSVWPGRVGGIRPGLLGPRPCSPSVSPPCPVTCRALTGCQLTATQHQSKGGSCDQAPQEVLETQAQLGCPWEGQSQQGPGLWAPHPLWPAPHLSGLYQGPVGPRGHPVERRGLAGRPGPQDGTEALTSAGTVASWGEEIRQVRRCGTD